MSEKKSLDDRLIEFFLKENGKWIDKAKTKMKNVYDEYNKRIEENLQKIQKENKYSDEMMFDLSQDGEFSDMCGEIAYIVEKEFEIDEIDHDGDLITIFYHAGQLDIRYDGNDFVFELDGNSSQIVEFFKKEVLVNTQ